MLLRLGSEVHVRRLLLPIKSCGMNVSYTWGKNTGFFMIVVVLPGELWMQRLVFSCHPASEHYEGTNKTLLTFSTLLYRFWENGCFQIMQSIHCFFQKEEALIHALLRDFPTYILPTAVPVLTIIFLIHALGFLSLLGCQNYWKSWKLMREVSDKKGTSGH